jgi:hypothetical protein
MKLTKVISDEGRVGANPQHLILYNEKRHLLFDTTWDTYNPEQSLLDKVDKLPFQT